MRRAWGGIAAFGRFWYGFIIGDDWVAAAGVLVMLGAAYGLRLEHIPAWWAGPVVITTTLLITLRRAARRPPRADHDESGPGNGAESSAGNRTAQPDSTDHSSRERGNMDITEQILADHHEQRRMFALLDEIGEDPERLKPVWDRLSILLEVHADAEERLFYPRLLSVGTGAGGGGSASAEAKDAIHDHDDIRDGIRRASRHPVGSGDWWQAVTDTRTANSDHMAEEEREALADFRRHAAPQARHELGIEFAVYEAAHAGGVPLSDQDADRYVADHSH